MCPTIALSRPQLNLRENKISAEGAKAVGEALKENGSVVVTGASFNELGIGFT